MDSPSPAATSSPSPTTSPETTPAEPPSPPAPPRLSPFFRPTSPPPLDTTPTDPWSESPDEDPRNRGLDDDSGSAPRSTGSSRARLRGLRESIKGAIHTIGGVAHQLLTREGTPERDAGLYLPDDDDVKNIGEPLAGLASRRLPEGATNPDATDLIGLVVGVAGYLVKQAAKRAELARQRAYLQATIEELDEPSDAAVDV